MRRAAAVSVLRLLALSAAPLTAGCQALPSAGPTRGQVLDRFSAADNPEGALIVRLDPRVAARLRALPERSPRVGDQLPPGRGADRLGPGDVLAIAIYEAGDGLFTPRRGPDSASGAASGSSAETLPRIQIDRAGLIKIPYAGEIRVAGRTTTEVQRMVEDRLAGKTSQAQVVVSLVANESSVVFVSGDVKAPGRFPLTLERLSLLDVVAMAGGPTHSAQDTLVKVVRGGGSAATSLRRIQTDPQENVPIEPQDRVQVDYLPRSYIAMGATGRTAEVAFDAPSVTLAEAVARAGGLDDGRANPEAVFLFRLERPDDAAAALGAAPIGPGPVPVVYQADMRDPETFFTMQRFDVRDKDLIYVANAPTVQIYKFLQLIYTFATPAFTAKTLSQ